jgi:hypothetical protein
LNETYLFREPTNRDEPKTMSNNTSRSFNQIWPSQVRKWRLRVTNQFARIIRGATAKYRMIPGFLIIGGLKCGTTSLYEYLCKHPQIRRARFKELFYFDRFFHFGPTWYQSNFPVRKTRDRYITGEASPHYIQNPLAPIRVREALPNVKIIALLRDPVTRLISHYQHNVRNGWETLSLDEALAVETTRVGDSLNARSDASTESRFEGLRFSYFGKGLYEEQLERWYSVFPGSQIKIIQSELLFDSPAEVTERVLGFLGLPAMSKPQFPRHNQATNPMELPKNLQKIADAYVEPNERLFALINQRFDWTSHQRNVTT